MKYLFLAFVLLSGSVAHAQNQKSAVTHKISYQRALPKAVSLLIPQNEESYFFGKFRLQQNEAEYAVHLFGADLPSQNTYEKFGKQKFTLDIFQVNASEYQRISRVPLDFVPTYEGNNRFGCQWFWADAHKKNVPVLQFGIWGGGIYGNIGNEVYVSFKDGLEQTPSIRVLDFGAWRGSDTLGEENVVKSSEGGMAQILVHIYPNADVPEPDHVELILKWDGENFVPTKPLDDFWRRYVR